VRAIGDSALPQARIIALANHKGGTAKTTTAVNLAACLAEQGRRVLLIDLDPQGSASSWLGVDGSLGIHAVLTEGASLESQIVETNGVAVIAASRRLAAAERVMAGELGAETLLRRKMAEAGLDGWHYILLDAPPAVGLLAINALAAATEALIPVEAHVLALSGVMQIMATIDLVRERFNPSLTLCGFVICRYDARTRHSIEVKESLAKRFAGKTLPILIRENVRLAEAPSFGRPIIAYSPRSTGAADYRALAAEIIGME
jgi:chromosome partitioning protein